MMEHATFVHNETGSQFELHVNGQTAFVEYYTESKKIYLTHTEVPNALGGKGVGKSIVEKTLHYIKDSGYTLAPLCPFVAAYLKRNPDWQSILANGYHIG